MIECDPPRKLTITWNVNWPDLVEKLGPTLVTYEIEPAGEARAADDDCSRTTGRSATTFVRRPNRLAGDPVQPQELLETGDAAGDPDGTAAANADGAEEDGDQNAIACAPLTVSRRTPVLVRNCGTRREGSDNAV